MNTMYQTILFFISYIIYFVKCDEINYENPLVNKDFATTNVIDFSTTNAQHQDNIPKWISNIINEFSLTVWIIILVSFAVCFLCCLAATCFCCRRKRKFPVYDSVQNPYLYYNNV